MADDEGVDALLDPAIESMRHDWLVTMYGLAVMVERYAATVKPHDEACGSSMEFVGLRLKRMVDRLYVEGVESDD